MWGFGGRGEEVSARLIPPILLPYPTTLGGALPFGCNAPSSLEFFTKGVRLRRDHPGHKNSVEM